MSKLFSCEVGLSDHAMEVGVSVASIALGATVIEKHFTLNCADAGVDSSFFMEPTEMAKLMVETEWALQALGLWFNRGREKFLQFRRSLCIVKDLKAGDVLTRENVLARRPGLGLSTKCLKTMKQDVKRGTVLGWKLFG